VRLAAETTRLPEISRVPILRTDDAGLIDRAKLQSTTPYSTTIAYAISRDMPVASRTRLLKEISNCFADRSRRRASVMQGLFGPIAVCVVGGCVLLVVLALFLPLVQLINALSM